MTFWSLTVLDLGALAFFLLVWLGYVPFLAWRGRRLRMVGAAMIDHRRAWMNELLGRDMKVADTAIVGHIMSTSGFFASTTVIVIGALLGVLVNLTRGGTTTSTEWLAISPPSSLEIKVVLILVVAVYAFQSFTWAIRQANFAAVLIGAAPRAEAIGVELRARLAVSMGNIITGVAASYDNGMRAYYFALGALTWVVSPVLFFLTTVGVVGLLLHRQTRSGTAIALREIAAARSEAAKASQKT